MIYSSLVFLALWAQSASAAATTSAPTVQLDSATVTGTTSSSGTSAEFLGIPFAQSPIGDLRFQLPQPNSPYTSDFSATAFGPSCPQQAVDLPIVSGLTADVVDLLVNSIYGVIFPDSEDCLTINVVTPVTATPTSNLPVVVADSSLVDPLCKWLSLEHLLYDGSVIVDRSIQLGTPVVYVSMNYRLNAFGFLASSEVRAAGVGNLGLQDQRQALRWVQQYIGAFGGDPTQVTIWGESAGAISVALHMVANDGDAEGLFRAGFMESGSPIPVGPVEHGQVYYDAIVSQTGCSGASDTLACLRTVPYATLKAAMNNSPGIFAYQSLSLAWLPREDGTFLTENPQQLVLDGKVADIPFITGDCDDEGTLFSLSTLNVTTDDEFTSYITNVFLPGTTQAEVDNIAALYPSDITQGSPFDTGILNALTPQYKRIAAFMGDGVFQAPRRFFLQQRSGLQKTWAFQLTVEPSSEPTLQFHGTDLLNVYGGGGMADYLIRFVVSLNPNTGSSILDVQWPQYSESNPQLLTFLDGLIPIIITQDNYRVDAMNALINFTLANPL
ncbi:hypothetical protein H0H92_005608 [Tricholoma furcatifolium]|nr:hypothetical protein H0H92_005608 [Tricholoma furcatifolium]